MKKHSRNLLCLMFAFMLAVSVLSMACASEALIGQMTRDGHTIVSIQYAYNEAGVVHLTTKQARPSWLPSAAARPLP